MNTKAEEKAEVAEVLGFGIPPFESWPADDRGTLASICGKTATRLGYGPLLDAPDDA